MPADDDITVDGITVDFERMRAEHQPDRHNYCRACGEDYPCGPAWAADKVLTLRARRRRRRKETHDVEAQDRG